MQQFKWLKEWWFLIIFAGAVVIGYTNMSNHITDLTTRVTASEIKITAQDTNQNDINIRLSAIQTDILWIKLKLSTQ